MDIYKYMTEMVKLTLEQMKAEGTLSEDSNLGRVRIEQPNNKAHGDLSTNAAMLFAKKPEIEEKDSAEKESNNKKGKKKKKKKKNNFQEVKKLAELIKQKLEESKEVESVEIVKPGFINITFTNELWDRFLTSEEQISTNIGNGEKVNVEFVSANPTGPLHIGHCRGAIYGDSVARLLERSGYDVTKEYYINDYGSQIDKLARSLYWRYEELLGLHSKEEITEGFYPGDYLIPVAEQIKKEEGCKWFYGTKSNEREDEWLDYFKLKAVDAMMELIKENLKSLNIEFDKFSSERSLVESGKVEEALRIMDDKGLLYYGETERPKGRDDEKEELEETKQKLLFRSTEFGDDYDRVVKKADGGLTYFSSDIAYHFDKYHRGFKNQIDVWGADHNGYIARIKAAVQAITDRQAALEVLICQIVNLEKNGKQFRMSKRAGNFVLVDDVLENISIDEFRLFMLTRSPDTAIKFDLEKVKEESKDNIVYYIQSAYAKTNSVVEKFNKNFPEAKNTDILLRNVSIYEEASEKQKDLIRLIADYPSKIEAAAKLRAPHLICKYLHKLSSAFHSLLEEEKLLKEGDLNSSLPGLALALSTQKTIQSGLDLLGVTPTRKLERRRLMPEPEISRELDLPKPLEVSRLKERKPRPSSIQKGVDLS